MNDLPLWAEIDLGAIRRNVQRLKERLDPKTKLLAVVKANAYGHGVAPVAKAAVAGGADWLGVARVDEGEQLREAGIAKPVLLMSEPPQAGIARAAELGLTPTLYTEDTARAFDRAGASTGSRYLPVHVKVDTGMHRYGVSPEELPSFMDVLSRMRGISIEGIWSHLASAEDSSPNSARRQIHTFDACLSSLGGRVDGFMRHIANSAAALRWTDSHYDMVRFGLAIYGYAPESWLGDGIELEPAMQLKARVGAVRRLAAGNRISYGENYELPVDANIATVTAGYADGVRRDLSNRGDVLLGGKRHRISGAITMDHLLVDIGDDQVKPGEEAVLLGRQGGEQILATEIADLLGTISYEVLCGVSARVPRIYTES